MATLKYTGVVSAGPGWTQVRTETGKIETVYGDRALRNNNPGNIEYGPYTKSMGALGTDNRFAVFPDRATGTRAQAGLIFDSAGYRNLTLRDAIAKYAPAFENNSAAYAASVAAASGVSLDTKMSDIPASKRDAVLAGMQAVEGNTSARAFDALTGAHDYTLDTTSAETPANAPSPFGANSSQAFAQARPDNFTFAGPKGKFSLPDTGTGPSGFTAPVGKVSRGPALGPASLAPDRPMPSGPMASPNMGSMPPDRNMPMGPMSVANATPSPARPDNLKAAGPVGMGGPGGLYVGGMPEQQANLTESLAPDRPMPMGVNSLPNLGLPATMPVAPPIAKPAPVQTVVSPPRAVVTPPAPRTTAPVRSMPVAPSISAGDVYSGTVGTAKDSSGLNSVSRYATGGPTYVTNKYGVTTETMPDGTQVASFGAAKTPQDQSAQISGPLGPLSAVTAPGGVLGIQPAKTELGQNVRSGLGLTAGAALGSTLGPIGALIGALIGKQVASGQNPLGFLDKMNFARPQSGLAFPTAPANPLGQTASSTNNSLAGMRSISPAAAAAIGKGQGGLY